MSGIKLEDMLDKSNGLYKLANRLNWDYLMQELGSFYAEGPGRPEIPIRVIAGLHYLKYLENESDENFVKTRIGNIFVVWRHSNIVYHVTQLHWSNGVNE